jgi:hypothetical protein
VVGLDADEHILHPGVLLCEVVGVVCHDQRDVRFAVEAKDALRDGALLLQPVVHQLKIIAVRAEEVPHFDRVPFGCLEIPGEQQAGKLPARQADRAMRPSLCSRRSSRSMRGLI